jgi:hypothetical protein
MRRTNFHSLMKKYGLHSSDGDSED